MYYISNYSLQYLYNNLLHHLTQFYNWKFNHIIEHVLEFFCFFVVSWFSSTGGSPQISSLLPDSLIFGELFPLNNNKYQL